jgi:hypothetical protein
MWKWLHLLRYRFRRAKLVEPPTQIIRLDRKDFLEIIAQEHLEKKGDQNESSDHIRSPDPE